MTQTLTQLEYRDEFIRRHIGSSPEQIKEMLDVVGISSLNELTQKIVPDNIQLATPPNVGGGATEQEALAELKAIARKINVLPLISVWDMRLRYCLLLFYVIC